MQYNQETINNILKHKEDVAINMGKCIKQLLYRLSVHDDSKLGEAEYPYYEKLIKDLKDVKYGSNEYKQIVEESRPGIEHHYQYNQHHPEYHKDGIGDMSLFSLLEMTCDWLARINADPNATIEQSLEINKKYFEKYPILSRIIYNTYIEITSC
jgi:hypothetical protein